MLDVVLFVILSCVCLWGPSVLGPFTGVPLALLCLAVAWYTNILPSELYTHSLPSVTHITAMVVVTDVLQTIIHTATHLGLCPSIIARAHRVHHTHTSPTIDTAFHTGVLDAIVQLIIPLYASLHIVRPNRTSAILFGGLYSNWLIYLHSDYPDHFIPFMVTPEQHRRHHKNPRVCMGHVLRIPAIGT